ncbi:cytochrome P450, partial [Streptomyces sp. NPDC056525]|uniref:cytochrome P450 n=1 Tax=Streptomyces sp. NPDC056525 TaxID=3345852 RepID=UPI0036823ED3
EVRGVTIPKGSTLWLVLASGNRDPQRFENPDRFDPDRPDIQHLGLGSGIHSCFGAPLARLEAHRLRRDPTLETLAHSVVTVNGSHPVNDPPCAYRVPTAWRNESGTVSIPRHHEFTLSR